MNIKKMLHHLKNPRRWHALLASKGLLNWMSDDAFLKLAFRMKMGQKLNLKKPRTFNEKLQWLKLHDRKPLYTQLADKYDVRQFVEETIGQDYLIPLVGGPWDSFDEIDFDALPEKFVLKCTHDSGGLVVCRDKAALNKEKAREKIEKSLQRNFFTISREWPYRDIPPKIIAEQYMEDENPALGLTDYKFFCFNGEPKLLYVSEGLENHATAKISFFDMEGKLMPFHRSDFAPMSEETRMPDSMPQMAQIAEKLARQVDCPFVRIDLYSICGKIYFSEVTFFPCGGMLPFSPAHWDDILGQWIKLPFEQESSKK